MPRETPWFTPDEREALNDFWRVYGAQYEVLNRRALAEAQKGEAFAAIVRAFDPADIAAQTSLGRQRIERGVLAGEWADYEKELRAQGHAFASLGVPFQAWIDMGRTFDRHLIPLLVKEFGSEPDRLAAALIAAQQFVGRALGVLGEAYLARKKQLVADAEARNAEARRHSADLELENLRIQEASRSKSDFLANMSHELRTPLNSIIGFAEVLFDGEVDPGSPEHKEFLGDILRSGKHLLQLINDVLDLAKVEAGKLQFYPEMVRPPAVVAEVVSILRAIATAKRIHVEVCCEPGLDELYVDPVRLKQVLYNYISNALKFTPEGGKVIVRVLSQGAEDFRVEVRDTGIGIAPESLAQLFVEFQQLRHGMSKTQGGTGLGLALTKRLAEAQGGSVGVESEPSRGSTFWATLPRRSLPL